MKTLKDCGILIEPGQTRTTCPECSPTRTKANDPCLSVDPVRGLWFCHHCGWSGGVEGEGGSDLAKKTFSRPVFVESEIKDQGTLDWFSNRGIGEKTLAALRVKFAPAWMAGAGTTETIQFPYYMGGEVVNIKHRTMDKRFRQEKNAIKCLYNYDGAMCSTDDRLIITEGEVDLASLFEIGFRAVVSVPDGAPSAGAKSFSTKFDFLTGAEPLFAKFDRVILAVDNDEPGKRLEEELARRIGVERCMSVAWPDGCKDANDVLVRKGPDILRQVIQAAKLYPVRGVATVDDLWDAVFTRHSRPEAPGAELCWPNMKGIFNVEQGQMTVVSGIPSHGKSSYVDALRVGLWRDYGWPSAAFSPENWPADDHLATICEMMARKNFNEMSETELLATMNDVREGFFFIQPENDSEMMTVDEILSRAKALVYRYGIQVLVIDPWNEVDHDMQDFRREDQYISRQLAKIRRFARMNNVHVFLVAHPSKMQKDKDGNYPPPTPYDIAGGAMWRNKADNCLCVYRPDVLTGRMELHVQKIRFRRNGTAGKVVSFIFHVGTSTYHPATDLPVSAKKGRHEYE